jgi:hypothetical protein
LSVTNAFHGDGCVTNQPDVGRARSESGA